jgi:uncharacterized NAD(P)/FAD-binding protein YdhS
MDIDDPLRSHLCLWSDEQLEKNVKAWLRRNNALICKYRNMFPEDDLRPRSSFTVYLHWQGAAIKVRGMIRKNQAVLAESNCADIRSTNHSAASSAAVETTSDDPELA